MSTIPIEKAVEIALEQHRAGNFARAEALYLEILRQDPGNVDAIHLLGVLAHQGKRPDIAVQLISKAIERRPEVAVFHYNLAEALHASGRTEDAIASYRKATELAPEYFEAHNNLANALNELHRHGEAEAACRRAIELQPGSAAPLNNLGNALRGLNRPEESIAAYRAALKIQPDFAEAMANLATALCWAGQYEEGIETFHAAIRLKPSAYDLHNNLGTALSRMTRYKDAIACFQTALDLCPTHAEANNNLGAALRSLGKVDEPIPYFQKAIELKPDFAEAHKNLALAYSDLGRKHEALQETETALKLRPKVTDTMFLRAILLRDLLRVDEAVDAIKEVIELEPDNLGALTSLGYTYLERGDLDEAMAALKRSVEMRPDAQTHSNVLMTINYHPGYSPAELLAAHRGWAELHEKPYIAKWKPHQNDRSPDRKLRVGYVSPDFRGHSVSYFLTPILEHHDHGQVEVFGYAHVMAPDMHTWRLRAKIDQWRETAGRNAEELADLIREDRIDILVDLAGHTGNNALTVFVRKPAPVQINMIGFPSTTGLTSIDYRITDARCDPPGVSDPFNTETLWRMPDIFWCYSPPERTPEIGALPADDNRGGVTFSSVNNFTKVTPHVQRRWAQILRRVPNSRLIFQTTAMSSEHTKRKVTALFASEGVDAQRLEFRKWSDFNSYVTLLERSDITLDPWPFNGGTTTCHSLWMGAPVISVEGRTHAARMGLSMLSCIGLPELCAKSEEDYVDVAVKLAGDLQHLRELRATMRQRLLASPLLDGKRFTRNLESAYRQMWHKWCASGT